MKEMWDERYAAEEYVYGEQPNRFFKELIDQLEKPGRILFPAEGEGRNAVYAAQKGFQVLATDISEQGRQKALALAKAKGVEITYYVGDLRELDLEPASFDAVVLIFAHFSPELRLALHRELAGLLAPGGRLIFEGFSTAQLERKKLNPKAGGPGRTDMLFTMEMLRNDFPDFEVVSLVEQEVELDEGPMHKGISSVIRFVGVKA